ncbi:hypothetical protein RI129_007341 [Pyrocoelia pectoralis]|uniref:Proteasome inhibitor PI31 subunit n=1 Tax=Pyrocoelia pectoralis TaxID=417401 RepID=A0AAN7VDF3_9COLE
MAANLFGWDLLYNSVKDDIKNNQDVLVCLTHLVLISNGFKCIGLGDSKNIDGTEAKSEILPPGWNNGYAIRYVFQGRLYNLRATNIDDAIMINLIRVQERTVSMVQLNNKAVIQLTGSLDQMIPNNEELAQTIKTHLIDKITISNKYKDGASQTANNDPPRSYIPNSPSAPQFDTFPSRIQPERPPPLGVGRSDLDPLGGMGSFPGIGPLPRPGANFIPPGGGGMLFVPPGARPPPDGNSFGVPPGSVPPGARFDPFRPPDVDPFQRRPNRRDNDDFLPPDFDNMYM